MSSLRYRRLITNLPSMAAVVNSFQTPEVQRDVFRLLVDAMEDAVAGDDERDGLAGSSTGLRRALRNGKSPEVLADVVEGDSIHSAASGQD
jgi:hypothetical protein